MCCKHRHAKLPTGVLHQLQCMTCARVSQRTNVSQTQHARLLTWLAAAGHSVHPIGACGNWCTGISTVTSSSTCKAAQGCATGEVAISDCDSFTAGGCNTGETQEIRLLHTSTSPPGHVLMGAKCAEPKGHTRMPDQFQLCVQEKGSAPFHACTHVYTTQHTVHVSSRAQVTTQCIASPGWQLPDTVYAPLVHVATGVPA
jgi:hypothetical protein